jgi:hypothetical protein
MAEAAWKARFRQHVVFAHGFANQADEGLKLLKVLFQSPVLPYDGPVAKVANLRVKLGLAMRWLTDASQNLNHAVVLMYAAELLARHGGNAANPSVVLPSIQHFGQQDAAEKAAVTRIQIGQSPATEACRAVDWCRGYLSMAIALVDSPIPGWVHYAEREYRAAFGALKNAIEWTEAALAELIGARQILGC